ncbi:SAM-dependent DNA methyltransferase, partial [Clostridium saudiense]|nr:SAM-dependent DNA methyltransferase [Clostridium saudiense]
MSVSEIQREQQSNLQTKLWDIANDLRGNMEANEFKN